MVSVYRMRKMGSTLARRLGHYATGDRYFEKFDQINDHLFKTLGIETEESLAPNTLSNPTCF